MTIPGPYELASEDFNAFLRDARDIAGLGSTHQAYTMVQGVLQAFRRRLSVKDALRFADVLPPVLRALFVAGWDVEEPRRAFGDRPAMTVEVQSLRGNHNVSPDTSIRDVAQALEHAARALEMASGSRPTKQVLMGKLIGWMFKGGFVGPRPFGRNAPTGADFVIHDAPDFAKTKARLRSLLVDFHTKGEGGCHGNVHGFFGPMTGAE